MSKKKERPEAEGYNYMDTYGDLVTLLLTFFVLLYAFSSTDAGKWEMLVQAFTGRPPSSAIAVELSPVNVGAKSFTENTAGDSSKLVQDNPDAGAGGYAHQTPASQEEINQEFDALYEDIQGYIEENNLGYSIVAEKLEDVIIVRVLDGVIFESGSADVIENENRILADVGNMFRRSGAIISQIQVEGHTDDRPIRNAQFEDNWDLSAKRATNVVRYFHNTNGLDWDKFSAAGYGEFRPVADNSTPEGRQQNRRVNFIIERAVITELQTTN
ncbi:MAG: OmpA family protein [Clostridia bacterium]|nr:OmpA family protein [Clostridia bacterium]